LKNEINTFVDWVAKKFVDGNVLGGIVEVHLLVFAC
jgi:hypothetical protein